MRILFLVPQPFLEVRGSPLAVRHIVQNLARLGHEIHMLAFHLGEPVSIPNTTIHRIVRVPFVKRVPIGPSYTKLFLDPLFFLHALWLCSTRRFDAIHAVEEGAFLALPLSLAFGVPLVYDMDSLIPDQLAYTGFIRNRLLLRLVRAVERWTILRSAAVVSVCAEITNHVREIAPSKLLVQIEDVPNVGAGNAGIAGGIEELRERLGLRGKKVVAYIGNFEPYQGVELLARSIPRVLAAVPEAVALFVGGRPEDVEGMRRTVAAMGVEEATRFLGQRPIEELPLYMGIADVLASPRVQGTNTPMKVYSYMGSGKPVVATDLATHTQVLDATNSLLAAARPEEFGAAIVEALSDGERAARIGAKAKLDVEARFSGADTAGRLAQVYERLPGATR